MAKIRLDELVLQLGFASSRSEAKALIMTGKVREVDRRHDKPGVKVSDDINLFVEPGKRFVSPYSKPKVASAKVTNQRKQFTSNYSSKKSSTSRRSTNNSSARNSSSRTNRSTGRGK